MENTYYANGKLLLTAEYFVLDGAIALACPTKFGQSLAILPSNSLYFTWKSFNSDGSMWFEGYFDKLNFNYISSNDIAVGKMLEKILKTILELRATPPQYITDFSIETHLSFPREWGLGTSSTLIYNISKLFNVNPFLLLEKTFGGSGYDIACAGADSAILFNRKNNIPTRENVEFKPFFTQNLYFIYLGHKQNSREGIALYKKHRDTEGVIIDAISDLTIAFLQASDIEILNKIIIEHENIVQSIINLPRAKDVYFSDYWGEIKSLGAWGGDFVLATSDRNEAETIHYFHQKGFSTVLTYDEIIL